MQPVPRLKPFLICSFRRSASSSILRQAYDQHVGLSLPFAKTVYGPSAVLNLQALRHLRLSPSEDAITDRERRSLLEFPRGYERQDATLRLAEMAMAASLPVLATSLQLRSSVNSPVIKETERANQWLEEAENYRTHALIWQEARGSPLTQSIRPSTTGLAELLGDATATVDTSGRQAHARALWLAEQIFRAYGEYDADLRQLNTPNPLAPVLARSYYLLPVGALVSDALQLMRADVCRHHEWHLHFLR
eukprot:TRINITY_DN11750_c0_g1_i3.p1 TRINITY_DN11750_c0_g1~~TRINITY_DN11750_c0_g1_i3.p1  ORF type:complete len:249 (+),score=25.57 TRINITY_DN11750_c0_g1_i3:32-778(+)